MEHQGRGYRFDLNGWHYVHIEGDPLTRGFQHGWLLANELKVMLDNVRKLTYHDTGKDWAFFREAAERMWAEGMATDLRLEMEGIAIGMTERLGEPYGNEFSWLDILTWNGYEELTDYWWPTSEGKLPKVNDRCSAFMANGRATPDGGIVMAHNSWNNFEQGQYSNVILDIAPWSGLNDSGNGMFMQAAPGYINSFADFFITYNRAGAAILMGTETTIGGFNKYDPVQTPEFVRIRLAMQEAKTLSEFVDWMRSGDNGGYANTWLVGDVQNGDIMSFEQGLKYDKIRMNPACGYFIGCNAPFDPRVRNLESPDSGYCDIRRHQGGRQVRLGTLLQRYSANRQVDAEVAKTILADHHDVLLEQTGTPIEGGGCTHPCSHTVCGHYDLDAREYMSDPSRPLPFRPRGTVDGKVCTSEMAQRRTFEARFGNSCGTPFDAEWHLGKHPQWDYLRGLLWDRPRQEWTPFSANMIGGGQQDPPPDGEKDKVVA